MSNDNPILDSRDNCNAIINTGTNKLLVGCKNSFIPNGVREIGMDAFSKCNGLVSIEIPTSVRYINLNAFAYCGDLNSIEIPGSVENIGSEAFYCCNNLKHLKFGEGIARIGVYSFDGCSSLTSVEIPNSMEIIDKEAFAGCNNIKSIYLGSGIKRIEYSAFANCTSIMDVYCNAKDVPQTDTYVFRNSDIQYSTLYVPSSSIDAYSASKPWNEFGNIKEIETSGIKNAEFSKDKFDVYDLNGNKLKYRVSSLDGLQKGIYIIDGKKVIK